MYSRRLSVKILTVLVVLLLAGSTSVAEKVLLRARYKQGEKYLTVMVSKQEIDQTFGTQRQKIKQTMKMEMAMQVLSVDAEGTADIKVTYRRMAIKQESPFGTLDYDSADPDKKDLSHPSVAGYKALVGNWVIMTMSSRGEVKGIRGTERIKKSILDTIPEGPEREVAAKQLDRIMSADRFSQQMSGFSMVLPENPVGVGDTWKHDQKMNLGFANVLVRMDFKARRITTDTVDVERTATIESTGQADAGAPMTFTVADGSKQSGTTKVNRTNAALTSSELSQTMNVTIQVRGRTIKQNVTGTATLVITRDTGR
ncbi:MAG: hypothetical protein AMS16_02410 [Planctomycetes bacterium DG_58]|nr:MAG: hypothetical protein AMS16_02410 [Planctomycetes bacterium DG_58]KPL04379.1 MAG: hypothetical protein AMK75_01215 [Planctomycetes bacterium SM23_65]